VETKWISRLYHQRNHSLIVTDGVTVTSLFAGLLQKISAATNRLCQIALNRTLWRKFEKRRFLSSVNTKSHKMKSRKTRPAHYFPCFPNIDMHCALCVRLYCYQAVLWVCWLCSANSCIPPVSGLFQ
jgi:hypothetical protein